MNFLMSFKPKVSIAKFIGKMQKKSDIMKSGLDAMPLFLLDDLLNCLVVLILQREYVPYKCFLKPLKLRNQPAC